GQRHWRLSQLRGPVRQTTAADLERAIDELRPTDMLFTEGRTWTYTSVKAFHAVPWEPPQPLRVEVAKVAVVGDTEYAFLRHHTTLPRSWLWARRGTRLWFVHYIEEPDLSFTSTTADFSWLAGLEAPPHVDTRRAKTEIACTATVCLPALHSRSQYICFALSPFIAPLRVIERDYSEWTGDGGTFHFLLQNTSPQASGQSMFPNAFAPRPESAALRDTRRHIPRALEAHPDKAAKTSAARAPTPLAALRSFSRQDFHVTPSDEVYASWTDINKNWYDPHWACMKHVLLDILKEPCWELMPDVAVCTEPHLEKDSLNPAALLATRASATFRREAGTWRLLNYLDPLALYEEGNLPACPADPSGFR